MNLGDKLGITPAPSLGDEKWGEEKGRDSNPLNVLTTTPKYRGNWRGSGWPRALS